MDIRDKYIQALDELLLKLKADNHVIAVLLAGSLAYDDVWEKSDIDLVILVEDSKKKFNFHCIIEDGILINASIFSRQYFKRTYESAIDGGQFQSMLSKAQILFSRNSSLESYLNEVIHNEGINSKPHLLLKGCLAVAHLIKAQKWFNCKQDYHLSYHEICKIIDILSDIAVLLESVIPERDSIKQAINVNESLFRWLFEDLSNSSKEKAVIEEGLDMIHDYISHRTDEIFKTALHVIKQADDVIGITEIYEKISRKLDIEKALLVEGLEWLTQCDKIQKTSIPIRITSKSRIQVDEVAYYAY